MGGRQGNSPAKRPQTPMPQSSWQQIHTPCTARPEWVVSALSPPPGRTQEPRDQLLHPLLQTWPGGSAQSRKLLSRKSLRSPKGPSQSGVGQGAKGGNEKAWTQTGVTSLPSPPSSHPGSSLLRCLQSSRQGSFSPVPRRPIGVKAHVRRKGCSVNPGITRRTPPTQVQSLFTGTA